MRERSVILSGAKDLATPAVMWYKVLRSAQDDRTFTHSPLEPLKVAGYYL